MKKIDDSKLYLYATLTTFVVSLILALVSYYSISIVEPKVERLISSNENINENYKKAYEILKDPQIFARYENFDRDASGIKENILPYFDNKVAKNEEFAKIDQDYLNKLYERRRQGSVLGRNTMVFFLLLTMVGLGFYIYERKNMK